MTQVTAILVVHDGATWLPQVVAAVASQSRTPNRTIAVDTGSVDGSTKLLSGARIKNISINRGEVRLYPGNYSVYLDYKKEEEETQVIAPKEQKSTKATPAETSIPNPDNRKSVKLSYKEKREYEELEIKIPEMEEEKLQIEKKLYYNPPSGHTEIQKLASRLAELTEAIDQSTERWLELAERL